MFASGLRVDLASFDPTLQMEGVPQPGLALSPR